TVFVDRERRTGTRNTIGDLEHRFAAGDRMVLFAEGTSSDGNRVLPFRSALLGAVGLGRNQSTSKAASPVAVQPLSVAYTHVHGLPMGRQFRPRYAWYGDMRLGPHLWGVFCSGSVDVRVRLHPAVSPGRFDSRKHLARHCEDQVRAGVLTDLLGRPISPPTDAAAPLV
ncbi:MAG: lysophospholipid acyltransferase family protein, partial [Hyphomicrobiales bacterium]